MAKDRVPGRMGGSEERPARFFADAAEFDAWLAAHHVRWCAIRFDVVAVLMEPDRPVTLQHYEAAF